MNNANTNNNDNNDMINITFLVQANPYHQLLSFLQKSNNSCILQIKNMKIQKKEYSLSLSSKVPTDD